MQYMIEAWHTNAYNGEEHSGHGFIEVQFPINTSITQGAKQ